MEILRNIIEWDKQIFLMFNGCHNPFWDYVMAMLTTKEIWIPLYIAMIVVIARRYGTKAVVIIALLILSIVLTDQIANVFKDMVHRLRPVHEPGLKGLVHYVMTKGGQFGFFSAHAANSFALAFFTAKIFKRWHYTVFIFLWALLLCYTRIYVGAHYPLDVLAGIACGFLIGWLMYLLCKFIDKRFMATKRPMISEVSISNREILSLLLVFLTTYVIITIVVMNLLKFNMVILQNAM
ncbi:MAG: phosphatase PAP2 family protein [Bacteroidota bacterium]|nr:phosphatase PAP2 family protein [Bacteroidota bacterium]